MALTSAFAQVTPTSVEVNKAASLWFNSTNAAGLAITPLSGYSTLDAMYDLRMGELKSPQSGSREDDIVIGTEGATRLGSGYVWGTFTYKNSSQDSTLYNSILLDPVMDMPYYYADPRMSYWKKQSFDMSFKAATRPLWDRLSLGITGSYLVKSGAKQIDPRCSNFKYDLDVKPSLALILGKHSIGASLLYAHSFERTVPTNANSQESQDVAIMNGLGHQVIGVVGSLSSLGTMYYNSNMVGGSLQYGFNSCCMSVLAEGWYKMAVLDANQTPSKPQKMGSTVKTDIGGNIQALFGHSLKSKVTIDGGYKHTDGIEYVQEIDKSYEVQQWVTIAQSIRSRYETIDASVAYDLYKVSEAGYDWKAFVKGYFHDENDEYILPNSTFTVRYAGAQIGGADNLKLGKNYLLIGLNAGYRKGLGGEYKYGGPEADSKYVQFFKAEHDFLCGDILQAGAELSWSFPISEKMMMSIKGAYQFMKSTNVTLVGDMRHAATAGVSFTF